MSAYLLVLAAAALMAISGTPIARRLALRIGIVDHPNARKVHSKTMPLLGGVALYGASLIAAIVVGNRFNIDQAVGIFFGASLVSFLGIWDDRAGIRPLLKLFGQIVAAVLLVSFDIRIGVMHNDWLNVLTTILWVVVITNSFNLLDNMDGLSGGIAAVTCAFLFLMAASNGQYLVGSLAAAVLGACLGFLYHNFNPAKIFMGDTGSLFLGFTIAALSIKLRFPNYDIVTWMVPVLLLGVPIFDTALVIISRLRRGLNPLTNPGKDHISHRLAALGCTTREAVMALYLICGILGMASLVLMRATVLEGYVMGAAVFLVGVFVMFKLELGFGGFDGRYYRLRPPRRSDPGDTAGSGTTEPAEPADVAGY